MERGRESRVELEMRELWTVYGSRAQIELSLVQPEAIVEEGKSMCGSKGS
jgi:hypothetical protein